ncbi:UdgX family uracil-DNA binding protein [Limnoglobus roseus]|uniref:Type-4 uracil-DNA glycosylase n=1 Tax=Limnoglobus roseus TaxID=2598579 RepID=A0A5C1AFX1_9BACT|nr:UdgX family uracil-DNA binding protein [Limnoglobus roseus]QEL17113.1 DNA polymerase related protein [Limnoglobus roseus]
MIVTAANFDEWRTACRGLLASEVPPSAVHFTDGTEASLFAGEGIPPATSSKYCVPPPFLALAEKVACHREPQRWARLYRALWRLTHGEPHLLDLATDDDVHWLARAEKAVRRDAHKMKAFVRFRRVGEHFVAWHRPDHRIVRLTASFFARRFPEMHWSILTPDESVTWDGDQLHFGPGVPAKDAPPPDVLEGLWKTYYRATFNPARIKLKMMKKELPVRHWPTLPETAIIADLLAEAPVRVAEMVAHAEGPARSAAAFLPPHRDLASLREAATGCTACDLCGPATQTVFGEGKADARIVLVGEQPGDQEDREGRPFLGPAGEVLNAAMHAAGLDRGAVYVTNAVKHFKFSMSGLFRQHRTADVREVNACQPWLAAELDLIRPAVVVCLGATATQAVLGRPFRFADRRGEVVPLESHARAIATYHPAAVLRAPTPERAAEMRADLIRHLAVARGLAG